jgi:hypothetical protein
MEIVLSDGSKITFDDTEDLLLVARFQHLNTYVFDGSLPATRIRWAKLSSVQGFCSMYGNLQDRHEALSGPYIFIDERLRDRMLAMLADLVLIHEACHFKAPLHDATFVKEYLRALQRVSWEPLVGKCVPQFRIEELEK